MSGGKPEAKTKLLTEMGLEQEPVITQAGEGGSDSGGLLVPSGDPRGDSLHAEGGHSLEPWGLLEFEKTNA